MYIAILWHTFYASIKAGTFMIAQGNSQYNPLLVSLL